MNRLHSMTLLGLMTFGSLVNGDDPDKNANESSGRIERVTLYRDRALVTREIPVPPGEVLRSIVVPDLPQNVLHDSVFADGVNETVVRATRVSLRPAAKPPRQELQRLKQQVAVLTRQRDKMQHALDTVARDLEALNRMVNFAASAGKSDLEHGVLDAESLMKLTTFSMTQRRTLDTAGYHHKKQLQQLDEQLENVRAEQARVTAGRGKSHYQARIFVQTANGAAGRIRLSYLVSGCGWSPQYAVRGLSDDETVELRYSALIHQSSGEDWPSVDLVVSTASPSVSAAGPLLTALGVTTAEPSNTNRADQPLHDQDPFAQHNSTRNMLAERVASETEMVEALRTLQQQTAATLADQRFGISAERRDLALNALAGQIQHIELRAESQSWRNLAPDVKNDVASHVYALPQPVSLDSRPEQHVVQLLESELDGEMYHVATPLLSTYAYRAFQTINSQPVGLIGGPATVFLDGRFVGRIQIPSTARGQRLTIGFGADQQVRTRRELMDKQEVVQGGNRQLKFSFRLVISNFNEEEAVSVRLIDRMPHTRQTKQLSVTLNDPQEPLSRDALYRRILRPTGILRWDLRVPPGRHGSKAFDVDYSFTMEFDRSRVPTTEDSLAELQAQYQNVRMPSGMGGGFGGGGGGFGGP